MRESFIKVIDYARFKNASQAELNLEDLLTERKFPRVNKVGGLVYFNQIRGLWAVNANEFYDYSGNLDKIDRTLPSLRDE